MALKRGLANVIKRIATLIKLDATIIFDKTREFPTTTQTAKKANAVGSCNSRYGGKTIPIITTGCVQTTRSSLIVARAADDSRIDADEALFRACESI
jgi:hypothetical protein